METNNVVNGGWCEQNCAFGALGIDKHDIESYAKDLSGMLDLMTEDGELNTDDVEPMAHPMIRCNG